MIRMIAMCGAVAMLFSAVGEARTFTDTTYRTPGGGIVRKGMSKKDVLASFRKPDDMMALNGPKSCAKVELWTYVLDRQVLLLTFTGKNVQQVKIVEANF